MPLYICTTPKDVIDDVAKSKIAEDITRIHCEHTGAPAKFVSVFFLSAAPDQSLDGKSVMVRGNIRKGRTDEQKAEIISGIRKSMSSHAAFRPDDVAVLLLDTPASWVMEGGDIFPEPGDEAEWLAAHDARARDEKLH